MVSPILFAGGEDLDFTVAGGYTTTTTGTVFGTFIDTTSGVFRSGFARYALTIANAGTGTGAVNQPNTAFLRPANQFASSSFWLSARYKYNRLAPTTLTGTQWWIVLEDTNNLPRLRVRNTAAALASPFIVETVNTAGTATQIGSALSIAPSNAPSVADKIDIFVNYAVAGSMQIYINGALSFTFTGDVTTNGLTSLASFRLSQALAPANSNAIPVPFGGDSWSEVIVSTRDTRAMSLWTQAPVADGTTVAWDGAVTRVNGNTAGDNTPDFTATANLIEQYTVGAAPAGSYSVVSVIPTIRAVRGAGGPSQIDTNVRTGGVDYLSADQVLTLAWGRVAVPFDTNPGTAAAWLVSDLTVAGFNVGFKSIT